MTAFLRDLLDAQRSPELLLTFDDAPPPENLAHRVEYPWESSFGGGIPRAGSFLREPRLVYVTPEIFLEAPEYTYATFDPPHLPQGCRAMGEKSDFFACRFCKEGGLFQGSSFLFFWGFPEIRLLLVRRGKTSA